MRVLANGLTGFIALEHVGFMALEMFFWTKPLGLKIFRLTPQVAADSAALAANQGLYNGFLAAGLIWSLLAAEPATALSLKTFFLSCVIVAGVFGAATASRSILYIQAAPALLALLIVRFAR